MFANPTSSLPGQAAGPSQRQQAEAAESRLVTGKRDVRPQMLACVDDTPGAAAVASHSMAVASGLGLGVALGRVIEAQRRFEFPSDPIEWQLRNRSMKSGLERLANELGIDSRKSSVLLAGMPADELSNWARAHGVMILALARHDEGKHTGLGSTAQRLLDRGEMSLLLVPPKPLGGRLRYRRIMLPIDGSARAESVFPVAQRIARAHDAELVLVHVIPRLEVVDSAHAPQMDRLRREIDDHNKRRVAMHLDALRSRARADGLKFRTITVGPADPRSTLRRIATEEKIDLVVMSSHGCTGLGEVSCGSVTEYFALHTTMPLLIVRPNFVCGFASDVADPQDIPAFRFD